MIMKLPSIFRKRGAGITHADVVDHPAFVRAPTGATGPAEDWYCECDNPFGSGRLLNGQFVLYCDFCGAKAPWLLP
jgi:hypothetical protein